MDKMITMQLEQSNTKQCIDSFQTSMMLPTFTDL